MKNSGIILVIAIIICFCTCGNQSKTEKTKAETTASKKIEGFKSYENEWYSIQYPADWKFDVLPRELSNGTGSQHLA
ncbi:MAG: hypothetical protein IJ681_05320, partial [Bacteroidales bacterium]|nr:hypothetical protein [Bacteroidales bacterium]